MKSIIYFCPTGNNRPSGGVKIMYRHVEILSKKIDAKIFHFENFNFQCDWFPHKVDFKKNSNFDKSKEFAIIPEWMAVYHAKILQKSKIPYGVFVQNGFYLNTKPKNNFSDEEIKDAYEKAKILISYSSEITECIKLTFPKLENKISKINISVDSAKFNCTKETFENKENLITYMPRKKNDHAKKLLFILREHLPNNWKIETLENMKELDIIKSFKKSKIFLSFSDLEGFGLPPVEAALCGNFVVGYTGESGKEYWNQPIFEEIYSGDLRAFVNKIIKTINNINKGKCDFDFLKTHIKKLSEKYSTEIEQTSLLKLVEKIKNF